MSFYRLLIIFQHFGGGISDFINTMKTTFIFKFLLLKRFLKIMSLKVTKEALFKLTASLDFYVLVFQCCLTAWFISKLKSKVVLHCIDIIPFVVHDFKPFKTFRKYALYQPKYREMDRFHFKKPRSFRFGQTSKCDYFDLWCKLWAVKSITYELSNL